MTTKDGTLRLRDDHPVEQPDPRTDGEGGHEGGPPGPARSVRPEQQRHHDRPDAADEPDRQIDLGDQEHEHDPDGDRGHPGHLEEQVHEVLRGVEVGARASRRAARAARGRRRSGARPSLRREIARSSHAPISASVSRRLPEAWGGGSGGALRLDGAHRLTSSAIPGTCSSWPAVIAWTTSCCVTSLRSKISTRWPRRRTVIRSRDLEDVVEVVRQISDAEPSVGEPADEVEHLSRLRHAERGRRLVEDHDLRVPHDRLRDGHRLPLAAREARDRLANRAESRDGETVERLPGGLLHPGLVENDAVQPLASEEHVRDDVEVVRERQVLVDDLDPERRGVARPRDRHSLSLEVDLALVEGIDPGDPLDQGRLAGAVVADERHDLARPDFEVDLVERLHGAEALRDAGAVEDRRRPGGRPLFRSSAASRSGAGAVLILPSSESGGAPEGTPPESRLADYCASAGQYCL